MKKVFITILGITSAALFSSTAYAHEVKPGDTMSKIADVHGLSLEEITELNYQIEDINLIYPGQTVHTTEEESIMYISETNDNQSFVVQPSQVTQPVEVVEYIQPVQEEVVEYVQPKPVEKTQPVSSQSNSTSGNNWSGLAACESGGNPNVVSSNGMYHGLYQFDAQTWQSVGGSGVASNASAAEQTQRAQKLYDSRGSSPWPVCGSNL